MGKIKSFFGKKISTDLAENEDDIIKLYEDRYSSIICRLRFNCTDYSKRVDDLVKKISETCAAEFDALIKNKNLINKQNIKYILKSICLNLVRGEEAILLGQADVSTK